MVYKSPIRDQGATHFRKTRSNQLFFVKRRKIRRVRIAAPSGIPRNAATLVAMVEYDGVIAELEWLITLMKNIANGA